jgi:DNA-binding beta-propeller fold protein YncE
VDLSGKFAYVANLGGSSGNVSAYTIDRTTGALSSVPGSPFAAGSRPRSVAVDPSGKFAYVANQSNPGTVSAYTINSTTGVLSPVTGSPFAAGSGPRSVAVDPSSKFAYVANGDGSVSAYTIDSTTGALNQLSNSPFMAGSGPISVAVDPSGKFAYVANIGSANVSAYTIDSTTGALSQLTNSPFPAGSGPQSVAVDPSGKFAYVANQSAGFASGTVSAYKIDSTTGALSSVPGSPFAAGSSPQSVAIAVVNTTEPFATFKPQAVIDMDENAFVTFGSFTLGTGSGFDGIAPATEPVQLNVGTFSITIPAGSFRKNRAGGFTFFGDINGTKLIMEILPKGKGKYVFAALAQGANLAGTVNPVTIGLTIGDATGSASITAFFE